jgi:hypothetical protein
MLVNAARHGGRMKTSSAKAKGRRACQEFKILVHAQYPELEMGDVEVTSSGATGEDIKMSPAARRLLPITVEVKCQESLNVWAALEQAQSHAEGTPYVPVLAFKRNHTELFVALKARDFLRLVRKEEE